MNSGYLIHGIFTTIKVPLKTSSNLQYILMAFSWLLHGLDNISSMVYHPVCMVCRKFINWVTLFGLLSRSWIPPLICYQSTWPRPWNLSLATQISRLRTAWIFAIRWNTSSSKKATNWFLDVVSLFTSIPVELAIQVATDVQFKDGTLQDRTAIPVEDIVDQ